MRMVELDPIEQDAEARIAAHRQGDFRVRVRDADGEPVAHAEVTVRLVRHDFLLGANGFLLAGVGQRQKPPGIGSLVLAYKQAFAQLLNYATLPFYWSTYEPSAGDEHAARLHAMAAWCRAHGVRVKGHPLAWHETMPAWAAALPDEEVWQRLRARIGRLASEFREDVDAWDVFNEITVAARVANAVGRRVQDRGALACVLETLALARAANPTAELLYNDFNVSPAFEELVEQLLAAGAPVNALGIQSHMHKQAWPAARLWQTCETYARFGLPLHFTEVTIVSGRPKAEADNEWHYRHPDWPSTPAGEQYQLDEGRRLYTLLFSHPAVAAITWWDFADRRAWQGAPAGLLRHDMSPKPLADWLRTAFGDHWTTRLTQRADAAGELRFRGFFGTYTVLATTDSGVTRAGSCSLPRQGARSTDVTVD